MVVPQLIIDFLLWSPNITSVGLEDDNEIVMQIEPWTAAEKAKETRDQDTFGFVRAPAGSNVPDAEIQEATRAALRGVGYKMTKFHATFNEYGFRKPCGPSCPRGPAVVPWRHLLAALLRQPARELLGGVGPLDSRPGVEVFVVAHAAAVAPLEAGGAEEEAVLGTFST